MLRYGKAKHRPALQVLRDEARGEKIGEDGKHLRPGEAGRAEEYLGFCVRKLREAEYLSPGIRWATEIVPGCTVEELMGAVLAGQELIRGDLCGNSDD